jgi:hypothetical protein
LVRLRDGAIEKLSIEGHVNGEVGNNLLQHYHIFCTNGRFFLDISCRMPVEAQRHVFRVEYLQHSHGVRQGE